QHRRAPSPSVFTYIVLRPPPAPPPFPYTTLFRSPSAAAAMPPEPNFARAVDGPNRPPQKCQSPSLARPRPSAHPAQPYPPGLLRSEEHTSELQSRENLVCRLLLEKKKKK